MLNYHPNFKPTDDGPDERIADYWSMLLDLVPPLLRAWKLIVAVVFAAGVSAYVAAQFLPGTFVSTAYIGPLDEPAARAAESMMRSTPVLMAVVSKLPDASQAGATQSRQRNSLDGRIRFAAAKGADARRSSLYLLEIAGADPAQAKALLTALIDAWLAATKPQPDVAERLERELSVTNDQVADLDAVISNVTKASPLPATDPKSIVIPPNIADLIKLRTESLFRAEDIKQRLKGQSPDIVFSRPDLPDIAKGTSKLVVILGAMVATFVLAVVWISLLHVFRIVATSPLYGPRLKRIGEAMPWRGMRRTMP